MQAAGLRGKIGLQGRNFMDYALSEQQQAFRETAQRFARQKLAPHYQKRAKQDRIDRDMLKEMGELGLIGVDLPEKYGGLGESSATAVNPIT